MNYITQKNPDLKKLFCNGHSDPDFYIEIIEWVDSHMRGHIDEMKEVNDYLTHGVEIIQRNDWHNLYESRVRAFISEFGLLSIQTQSLMKMVVDMEWNANEIRRRQREIKQFPAAYQAGLIAHPMIHREGASEEENRLRKRAYDHIMASFHYSDLSPEMRAKYPNLGRLIGRMRHYYAHYMKKLRPRIYLLMNGSSTRLQDKFNIYDINGCVYLTEQENSKVENEWKPIIEHFKIRNFEDDFSFLSAGSAEFFGKINFAPDDSGKTRISYCIDPCVQCISKAIARCLDYVSRKFGNNCTKDQMRVLRNIMDKGYNKTGYIISTDMSKYSDTLQFYFIERILSHMGIPSEVCSAIRDLYTLPMYDSIRRAITPRTSASYQGQYGDFSMITLANMWIQCCLFDFYNEYYDMEDSATSGAVGDDTIMTFMRNHHYLFEICQLMYNSVGVSINKTKTHTLLAGEGCADFIKRILTSEGLVPYIRLVCFHNDLPGRWVEEGLRVCRDNLLSSEEQVREMCSQFLGTKEVDFIASLHKINGGVIDRPISDMDLQVFCYRNERLGYKYSNRRTDDLRHWIDYFHSMGYQLQDTCLVGYYEDWDSYFEFDDIQLMEDIDDDKELLSEKELEEHVMDRMLHCYSHGYQNAELDGIALIKGFTYSELSSKFPLVYDFIRDYNISEVYRYYESRQVRDVDLYYELMSKQDWSDVLVPTKLLRPSYHYSLSKEESHNRSVGQHIYDILIRDCSSYGYRVEDEYVWENYKSYLVSPSGTEYRLYKLKRETPVSRPQLPFLIFKSLLRNHFKNEEHAVECYSLFLQNLPSLYVYGY